MVQRRILRRPGAALVLILPMALRLLCGCGDSLDARHSLHSNQSALLGASTYENCTSAQEAALMVIESAARHVSRSHAYVECVDRTMRQTVHQSS